MKNYVTILLLCLTIGFASCTSKEGSKEKKEQVAKTEYMCPMDCEKGKTYDKQEKCPVCKMKLVDKKKLDKE